MKSLVKLIYIVFSFQLLISLSGCKTDNKVNVLIVTFDTTRADHIGAYGKENAATPVVDALAADGVLYEHALSPIPITLPSHSSIMTGKVPFTHGVRDNGIFALADENVTLAEILKENGYKTAAAIGSFPLTSQFGINQGFDLFDEQIFQQNSSIFFPDQISKQNIYFNERKAEQVNEAIMPWIEKNHKSPFFAWLHYFDPHHPHKPPSPYNDTFINDLYQGEIAYSDESFGTIIEQLKRLQVYDNTLIIFTADHGEGNGEHNEATHVSLIYNSTQHVPLVIKYPRQKYAGSRVQKWIGLVDIFPTVLNTLGIKFDVDIQGEILPIDNKDTETMRELYAETLSSKLSQGWGEQRGLLKNNYKYIYGPIKELYDLSNDPHELLNLASKKPELAASMKQALQDYLDEYQSSSIDGSIQVSQKTLEILRGLGYVQQNNSGTDVIIEKLDDSGIAPQLMIKNSGMFYEAKQFLFNKKYELAKRLLDSLLFSDPNNSRALELKIKTEINMGNFKEVKKTIENLPDTFTGISKSKQLYYLARINLQDGNIEKAKNQLLESEKPAKTIDGQYLLAQIQKKSTKAYQQHLINILAINDGLINIINELAISYFKDEKPKQSESQFKLAISKNPYYPKTFYNYGVLLKINHSYTDAVAQFRRAIKLDTNYSQAYFALVETLITVKNLKQAKSILNKMKNKVGHNKYYQLAKQLVLNYETE